MASDIFGPIDLRPYGGRGQKYVITIIDSFSGFAKLYPSSNISAKTLTSIFKKYLDKYPKPKNLLSDQGRQYVSSEFQDFIKDSDIKHKFTTAYNPACNGISERLNVQIGNGLRIFEKKYFNKTLQNIEDAYNSTYHSTIKTLPCIAADMTSNIFKLTNFTKLDKSEILNNIKKSSTLNESKSNKKRISYKYEVKQKVLVKTLKPNKLEPRWHGHYTISDIGFNSNYLLLEIDNKIKKVNNKLIKPFRTGQNVMNSTSKEVSSIHNNGPDAVLGGILVV